MILIIIIITSQTKDFKEVDRELFDLNLLVLAKPWVRFRLSY